MFRALAQRFPVPEESGSQQQEIQEHQAQQHRQMQTVAHTAEEQPPPPLEPHPDDIVCGFHPATTSYSVAGQTTMTSRPGAGAGAGVVKYEYVIDAPAKRSVPKRHGEMPKSMPRAQKRLRTASGRDIGAKIAA